MTLTPAFHRQCEQIIHDLRLGSAANIEAIEALPGGVASDIARVRISGRQICIKCARPQLQTSADRNTPPNSNLVEYQWLQFVSGLAPNAVPELLGHSSEAGGFAMAYLSESDASNYKKSLLAGEPDGGVAGKVAVILGQIHGESTKPGFDRKRFSHADNFFSLRIEPYLNQLSTMHPVIAGFLQRISQQLHEARIALVHGDVAPKNLLVRSTGPVFLDAEYANFSDPAFDVSSFLNHLMLNAVHMPEHRLMLLDAARSFWSNYQQQVFWEPIPGLATRVSELLPALMLARVDGKYPAQYLNDRDREKIRINCLRLLQSPPLAVDKLFVSLTATLRG